MNGAGFGSVRLVRQKPAAAPLSAPLGEGFVSLNQQENIMTSKNAVPLVYNLAPDNMEALTSALDNLRAEYTAAVAYYYQLEQHLAGLESLAMYPAVPSEQWQHRNGSGQYLYMIFRRGDNGAYQGPDGRRKVYVGNKPARIAEARDMARRRAEYEDTLRRYDKLRNWIYLALVSVRMNNSTATTWRRSAV